MYFCKQAADNHEESKEDEPGSEEQESWVDLDSVDEKRVSKHVHETNVIKRVRAEKKSTGTSSWYLLISENAASNEDLKVISWRHFDFVCLQENPEKL